jgi:hypothetical protein
LLSRPIKIALRKFNITLPGFSPSVQPQIKGRFLSDQPVSGGTLENFNYFYYTGSLLNRSSIPLQIPFHTLIKDNIQDGEKVVKLFT